MTATETEEGRRWAESRIKQLTGGDEIATRFMRQDFFEYRPQFKLIIAGNHKPSLRSVDEAIRRRFQLIPFAVTIPPNERDPELAEKLKAEWPGILQWLIEGCLEWQRSGLRPPKPVLDASLAYLEAEDSIAAWIDDKCVRDPDAWETSADLFASWVDYARQTGEEAGRRSQFTEKLEKHSFRERRKKHGRGYDGLRIVRRAAPHRQGDRG